MNYNLQKSQLGAIGRSVGRGNQGQVFDISVNVESHTGPLLYKEYLPGVVSTLDFGVLTAMTEYINSLDNSDADMLLSICSWPLAVVVSDQTGKPCGFIMRKAHECFRKSNFKKGGSDFKGFQHLFSLDNQYMRDTGCDPLMYEERKIILSRISIALNELHKRNIAVGDISHNNILVAVYPEYRVYFIDADSMSFQGKSILPDVNNETWNWWISKMHPNERSGTCSSDCFKLGLLALRLLRQDIHVNDGELPAEVSSDLIELIHKSRTSPAATRPKIFEWTRILRSSASTTFVANAFFAKGQAEIRQGNKQEALTAYDKAIFLDSNLADAYSARADLKTDLGDYKGAIIDYDQLIVLRPDQVDAYNNRGCCKYNLSDFQGAYDDFTQELSRNTIAVAFYNRASSSLRLGDNIGALADIMSGYAIDPDQLNHNNYHDIKVLLEQKVSSPLALLGAWMVINWKRNAALRKAATWPKGMPHTSIPPATNLSVASCIKLISARMSSNWKKDAGQRNSLLQQANLILAPKVRIVAGILVITSCGLVMIGRVEEYFKYERERSQVVEVQKLLDAGNYQECIDRVADIRFKLRDEFRALAVGLLSSCMNKQASANDKPVQLPNKEQSIKACGLEGSWSITARIEDSELREKILSLIKSNYCSDSYLDGSIIIASRNHAEQTAIDIASSLNRLIQANKLGVDAGFVAQSRLFIPLLIPFSCVVKTSSVESQNTNTYKCSARFHVTGGFQSPGVEMIFQTADGNGLVFNWSPSESGSTSSGGTSITCNERDMAVESTNKIGITSRIELPFQFLPCRSVSLNGICAMQERYNESNVYMSFGACGIERIENGRTGIEVVLDTGLRMRFSTSESNSRNRQLVSFYQRPSDIVPRTESFPWAQRQEGIYIDLDGKALLIGGIKI